MKIHGEKHRMAVTGSDLSGSVFDDVNLAGCTCENVNMSGGKYHNINLSGCASIVNSRLQDMTIDGIDVAKLLAFWHEHKSGNETSAA